MSDATAGQGRTLGAGVETSLLSALARDALLTGVDGGARRDRTDDLMLAKHALYQLSYGP